MRQDAGEDFDMTKDVEILEIDSPQRSVSGPYVVVYKDLNDRWAIVALDWWDGRKNRYFPKLGLRWFWDNGGNPCSHGYATWLVVPDDLTKIILSGSGLKISSTLKRRVEDFLSGKITGAQLE